ncbi:hypothetical protein TraAM80_09555 [Trypanosoma rangeli]|uniref:Uncharacterized protein n=1 Tax=Trypanosoma rangeli TaxID=5698 RepID=A0A3R7JUE9_TRYRA|nr:uncharacterized protein TraAM80_09555 [Trypanosoma rangeli]RNE97029.1 hypothetical protein TraAM80_09555 [Trypanosoma rangeli]|eukprot:RNE97029.1 hypothetical protein TraAM80_09555 [Trypanosoma rangeli]
MRATGNTAADISVSLAEQSRSADPDDDTSHRRSGSQTTLCTKSGGSIVHWLREVDAARGDSTPTDMEQEELLMFFKGRSQQGSRPMASGGSAANATTQQCGGEEEPPLMRPAVRLSPQVTPSAGRHSKPRWEVFSSAPRTDRSSMPGETSASRLSGGGFMMMVPATAAMTPEGHCGYSPRFGTQQTPCYHQQSPTLLLASLGRGFVHPAVNGNSSSCSMPDLSLPPSLSTGGHVTFSEIPAKRSGDREHGSTNAVLLEPVCGGSDHTTPPRQRILPVAERIRQPPSAPHHDRRCRDVGAQFCSNGAPPPQSGSLQKLRLNNPPKLCPPHAARLHLLSTGCEITTTTTTTTSTIRDVKGSPQ